MNTKAWKLLFKLRNNIPLEGDVALAKQELEALVDDEVQPVGLEALHEWVARGWILPKDAELHREGTVGFVCVGDMYDLSRLFWRVSFCEQIFGVVPDTETARSTLGSLPPTLLRYEQLDTGELVFMVVPFNAIAEWSDVAARRADSPREVQVWLDHLCDALVSKRCSALPSSLRPIITAKQTTGHLFHGLHVYKAKFFPRLARAFLNLCGGVTVLDPFAGSGTALTEASVMGMSAIGVDIDPLSVAIAQAKASLLEAPAEYLERIGEVQQRLAGDDKSQPSLFAIAESSERYALTPAFLRSRIPEPTRREVEADVAEILSTLYDMPPRSPLHIALSDALSRKFKFRFLGLGYGRFSLSILPRRVRTMYLDNLRSMANSIAAWLWLRQHTGVRPAPMAAIQGDARQIPLSSESVDSVVTSPPYMPASSGRENYLKSKAYAMTVLGLIAPDTIDALEAEQIGSIQRTEQIRDLPPEIVEVIEWMQRDPTRCVKAAATASYFVDIRKSLREIQRVLKPGGKCAYVVARRHVFYRYQSREVVRVVESAELTAELARQAGLEVVDCIHVELQKQNTVARPRSLDAYYETVILLRKG